MNDGHSGIGNSQVDKGGSGSFQLILAKLKQGNGQADLVIHATSNTSYDYGLDPLEFLASLGFTHYQGRCPFHYDSCFYRSIATLSRDVDRFESIREMQGMQYVFQRFAGKINELFRLRQQEDQILGEISIKPSIRPIFGPPVKIEINEKDVPLWIEEVKLKRLREVEERKATIQKEIDELGGFLPLLYGTGDMLEEAVIKALHFLGLNAEQATKGATVDILAQTRDGSHKFGFEVTGISGPIKKESKKLTQLLEFERIKEHGEKTVLVANTHNTKPISERENLEDFTSQVLDFLGRHPILLITGWNLYCMVRDVLEGSRKKEEIIEILYTTVGELDYDDKK